MFSVQVKIFAVLAIALVIGIDQGAALNCRKCSSKDNKDCLNNPSKVAASECALDPPNTTTMGTTTVTDGGNTDWTTTADPGTTTTDDPGTTTTADPGTTTTADPGTTTTAVPDKTTTAVPDKTTTAVPDKTTTAVPDKTTTAVPDKTTTAVPDKTTTAVPDKTTTAVPDKTTTGVPDTSKSTDGGGQDDQDSEKDDSNKKKIPSVDQLLARSRRGAIFMRATESEPEPSCYKLVYKEAGQNIVERGCAKSDACNDLKQGKTDAKCHFCNKDGCNGSSQVALGTISILLPAFLIFAIFRQ